MGLKPPRICCIGGNLESLVALRALLATGAEIACVVVPGGRLAKRTSDLADVPSLADASGIPVIQSADINSRDTVEAIADTSPQHIFVLGWSQLLRRELLLLPDGYVVGSHPSNLPHGRGRAPIAWTILEDLRETAVTLFQMDEGVDTGGILVQERVEVPDGAHAGELYELVSSALGIGFSRLYAQLRSGEGLRPRPQEGPGTYRHGRRDEDGFLDFRGDAQFLDRLIRASSAPYPGAYGFIEGQKHRIFRSLGLSDENRSAIPGEVTASGDGWLEIATGSQPIRVADVRTAEGEKVTLDRGVRFETVGGAVLERLHRLEQHLSHGNAT